MTDRDKNAPPIPISDILSMDKAMPKNKMPTYDYECLSCHEGFEAFQKMTDEPLSQCPKCKGKVKRLISSGSGLIFKGSGFYITDYKKKNSHTDIKPKTETPCSGCKESACPNQEKKEKS